jgi:hypothetical protein
MTSNSERDQSERFKARAAQTLIGDNLKRLRLAAMFTQEALAAQIDVNCRALSALEVGHGSMPIEILPTSP